MVFLVLTERIRGAIQMAIDCPEFDSSMKNRLQSFLRGEVKVPTGPVQPTKDGDVAKVDVADGVPLEFVKEVSSFLVSREKNMGNEIGLSQYWLHELLAGSAVYTPPQSPRMKSPELLNRLENIIADNSNADYARMVSGVLMEPSVDMRYFFQVNQDDIRELRGHLSAIVNIMFTIVAVFVAVYAASKTVMQDVGLRVLLGLFGAIIVAVAEAWLYMRHVAMSKPPKKLRRRRSSRLVKKRSIVIPPGQPIQMQLGQPMQTPTPPQSIPPQ